MVINIKEIAQSRKASGIDQHILKLDHIAYRIKMGEREQMVAELMNILPYREYKVFQVKSQNSITAAYKIHETLPVIVISEGLSEDSVVEKYCQKFGNRVHHLAYLVDDIEKVWKVQKSRGIQFTTLEIIGSEEEGIKQIFTMPIISTNHIVEFVQRFGDFDGFFTPSNIGKLMKSTEKLGEA
ncbi:MAG: VOC family protein [Promethearchaeota archaeon]